MARVRFMVMARVRIVVSVGPPQTLRCTRPLSSDMVRPVLGSGARLTASGRARVIVEFRGSGLFLGAG